MFEEIENDVSISEQQTKGQFLLDWRLKNFGFGQLYFYTDDGGIIHCENECMSKERVKEIMNVMIDNCIMDDEV